jgi:hypothetical protein
MRESIQCSKAFLVAILFFSASQARAGENYYMILFAYEGSPNLPSLAHTFATFHKVTDDGKDAPKIETQTISWLKANGTQPRLLAPPEPGFNYDLPRTLQTAMSTGSRITAWGPYRIDKELYDRAMAQIARLNSGQIAYKATDRSFRPAATNCIHALSDLPGNAMLDTGTAYGTEATAMVRAFFTPWILDGGQPHFEILQGVALPQYPIVFVDRAAPSK